MHPNASFYEGLEQQARLDHQHEEEQTRQARYESERHDRAVVRQELDRGIPEAEIEEHLELASEFVRLNPGRDVRAYIRGLIEEEKSGFHALSEASEPFREDLPRMARPSGTQRQVAAKSVTPQLQEQPPQETAGLPKPASRPPNAKTVEAETQAREYINASFAPDDWLAVVAVNRKTGETVQRVSSVGRIVGPEYQGWLRYLNATG